VESQLTVEDTGAHSEENTMEMTAFVPVQTATGTKYSDNLYSPCTSECISQKTLSQSQRPTSSYCVESAEILLSVQVACVVTTVL
jgi:hypothetical protein